MTEYKTCFIESSKVEVKNISGKQHVVVVGGGMSAEREISLISSKGVVGALVDLGYRVTFLDMGSDVATILQELKPDIVYNCLHGTFGEDGCLPGLLNILKIPYTHSGVLASAICFNKLHSKMLFIANNIKTPEHIVVSKSDNMQDDPMERPYVIKPLTQGSSIGVIVIFAEDDFNFKHYDFPYGEQILVEKYIKGREINVAILNGKAIGALEIRPLTHRFYDYESKYTEGLTEHICPAILPEKLHNRLMKKSEKICGLLGCNGIIRLEFILDEKAQELLALELNTHPGMTPMSLCPEIAQSSNISYTELVEQILYSARFEA